MISLFLFLPSFFPVYTEHIWYATCGVRRLTHIISFYCKATLEVNIVIAIILYLHRHQEGMETARSHTAEREG